MRHAARQPAVEPPPERPDLEAKADLALARHKAAIAEVHAVDAEIRDAIRRLPAAACDQALAEMLVRELRLLAGWQQVVASSMFDCGPHLEEARGQIAEFGAVNAGNALLLASLRARDKALEDAARQIPRQGGGGGAHARQGVLMRLHQGGKAALVPVAAAFWTATRPVRHALAHPAAIKLTAHVKLAAAAAAVPAGGLLIAGAVVVTSTGGSPASASAHGHGANPAASIYAATPIPSSSAVALSVVHPKAKHAARGKLLQAGPGELLPLYSPAMGPSSSPVPSSASPVVSVQAGPAVLSVSAASLDLSAVPQAEFTISATGNGWASWRIDTSGTDLEFSKASGVLQSGQSVVITVSLASALDGLAQQVFEVAGSQVTVALPLPLPAVSVDPSPSVSVPVIPTPLPS